MPTIYAKESKPITTFTKESKPNGVLVFITWDEATMDWTSAIFTWDTSYTGSALTTFTKETKPTTSFTKESHSINTSFTRESRPVTNFSKESKP